jgi:hypothetical protein
MENGRRKFRTACRDVTTTSGSMQSNVSGNGNKDSTISVHRIQ